DEDTAADDDDADEATAEEDAEPTKNDFLVEFARDFLAQAKGTRRRDLLAAAKPFLEKVHAAEDKKLAAALEKLGVDWSTGPAQTAAPQLELSLQSVVEKDRETGKSEAGKA